MTMYRLKVGFIALALLAVGAVLGAFGDRLALAYRLRSTIRSGPEGMRTTTVQFVLERRLRLSTEQRERLNDVLVSQEEEYRRALEPCRGDLGKLRTALIPKLEPYLDAEQRVTLAHDLNSFDPLKAGSP